MNILNNQNSHEDLFCPHFLKCSGCELSKDLKKPPLLKEATHYFKEKGITLLPLVAGKIHGYRYRAKLVVRGSKENPKIGLYKKRSHVVEEIPFCKVHHPKINEAVSLIKTFIKEKKIEPYDETSGKGLLKYIQLTVERASQKVQVAFVLNSQNEDLSKWDLEDCTFWHSVWLNYNPKQTNTILGPGWVYVNGARELFQNFGNLRVSFHPGSFIQANLELFEQLIKSIEEKIPQNLNCVEYYAGVGVIGLNILHKCQSVVCSEIAPFAEQSFNESYKNLNPTEAKKISFQRGFSEKSLELIQGKELVIVDPPRKGLDFILLNKIISEQSIKKIVYVSCGFKAFQRDCNLILEKKEFELESVQPFLFFPGSDHLELLAIFSRKSLNLSKSPQD